MQTIFLQQKLNGRNNMTWVKYGKDDLINLDKTTDIHIAKVQDEKVIMYIIFAFFIIMKIAYLQDILQWKSVCKILST